MNSLKNIALHY